jgi:cytochrome P450
VTSTQQKPVLDFDHHSVRAAHHREEVLAEVVPHPIFWTEAHGGYWVVTSHALIKRVLRDHEVFSSHKTPEMTGGDTIPTVIGPRLIPAEVDPPYHRTLRKLLTPKFHNKAVEKLLPQLETLIVGVIDEAVAKGEFDVVHDIANRIPAGSMVVYLGFPEQERVPFIKSVQAALDVMPYASDPDFAQSPKMAEGMAALGHAVGVIQALMAERKATPTDDVVSHLVNPEFGLGDDDIMWMIFTLLVGGAENPAAMIGNSLAYLAEDTELRASETADEVWRSSSSQAAGMRLWSAASRARSSVSSAR